MTATDLRRGEAPTADVRAGELARPLWRRSRFWLLLLAGLVAGAALVTALTPAPGRALDPSSPAKGGSKALAQVLRGYGVTVQRSTSLDAAAEVGPAGAVLVVSPSAYTPAQLRRLAGTVGRLVLPDPAPAVVDALAPGLQAGDTVSGTVRPGCDRPGARATGPVDVGDRPATTYAGAPTRCFRGLVAVSGRIALLGSADLLRNDALTRRGVAALDVNLLTADRALTRVAWLLPGTDAKGAGPPTVWALFPAGVHRAFVWLLLTGLVVVLWQARRLGPPVREPLPVVVRSAEVVEGHGRLYRRARARERAAAALRGGTVARLGRQAGLPPQAGVAEVVAALGLTDPARAHALLAGPPPRDDGQLLDLAAGLRELEAAAGVPPEGKDAR